MIGSEVAAGVWVSGIGMGRKAGKVFDYPVWKSYLCPGFRILGFARLGKDQRYNGVCFSYRNWSVQGKYCRRDRRTTGMEQ